MFPGAAIRISGFCGNRSRWIEIQNLYHRDHRSSQGKPGSLISIMPLSFSKKPALVVYVTCGDPDLATTRAVILAAIEADADVIELGVPFSDPVADGPVIQRASERALKHGTCLAQVLTLAAEVRQHAQSTGIVVFSYLNPILRMGIEKFCAVARHAGVDGVLLTDLPVEEARPYLRAMKANDRS